MGYFLGLLVVNANKIVFPSCCKGCPGWVVIDRHDVVTLLLAVPDLFACFCGELV